MEEKKIQPKALSMSNTKKEMLEAYSMLLKKLKEKREAELKPEKKIEEKEQKEVVKVAETLSSEGVIKEIGNLKLEIGKNLTQLSDGLEEEVNKFCEQNLPRYKRPRRLFFDKVPRSPTGKIEKPKLREKYAGQKESFKL